MHDGAFGIAVVVVHEVPQFSWLIILSMVLNNANLQTSHSTAKNMSDALPLLTLVKSKEVDERPSLGPAEGQLEVTLTMLCSFYSTEDLVQFLSSEGFSNLARRGDPWIEFELGLYKNHVKTLQFIPQQSMLTFADSAGTGAFENHVWQGEADDALVAALNRWVATVASHQ